MADGGKFTRRMLPARPGVEIMGKWLNVVRGTRTMAEVARRAGTSASVVCDLEHARLLPSEPKLMALFCDGCGMSPGEFRNMLFDFRLEYFLRSVDSLSEEARDRIRQVIWMERPR